MVARRASSAASRRVKRDGPEVPEARGAELDTGTRCESAESAVAHMRAGVAQPAPPAASGGALVTEAEVLESELGSEPRFRTSAASLSVTVSGTSSPGLDV